MTDEQSVTTVTNAVVGLPDRADALFRNVRQAARALQVLEEQHRLRTAVGVDVGEQVSTVLRALLNAGQALQVAGVHLREADGALALLGDQLEDAGVTR